MDIVAKFQGLCQVEIRRLLVIIGMVVAVMVVFQCFSKSLFLSVTDKDSILMMVGNASVINNSTLTEVYVDLARNKVKEGPDLDNDLAVGVENYPNENSQWGFTFKKGVTHDKSLNMGYVTSTDTETNAMEIQYGHLEKKLERTYKLDDDKKSTPSLSLGGVQHRASPGNLHLNVKQTIETQPMDPKLSRASSRIPTNNFTTADISILKRWNRRPTSISEMDLLLLRSRVSSHSLIPRSPSVRDRELLSAKVDIINAPVSWNTPGLYASVFRNVSMFKRSYELMESILKVYIYKEGEKPIFHQPIMRGIYASEGWFMKLIEGNIKFAVRDPRKAHLFYLPFSSQMLRIELSGQKLQSRKDLQNYLKNYVNIISRKYRFWNRTGGADHFLVACHDWGEKRQVLIIYLNVISHHTYFVNFNILSMLNLSFVIPNFFAPQFTRKHLRNCIKALCNANVGKGLKIGMDTSLPVTYVRSAEAPLDGLGGKPPLERSTLAFFAGSMHGYLRPILLKFWENKVDDMKIFGPMPRDIESKRIYREYMKSSKYCICARGYEVHTPRVVEAIFHECVPVIISDNYVPPFFEVLNWKAFSVFVQEKDIPNLRNILLSIPEERYLAMQLRVKKVQKHFLWNKKPEKYDVFHMILHSIWYNRVFNTKTK